MMNEWTNSCIMNEMKEMKEMKEMEKEMKRLKNITDRLWSEGKATKWENMTHTNIGVKKYDFAQRFNTIHKFMTKLTTSTATLTIKNSQSQQKSMPFLNAYNNVHKNQYKKSNLPRKKVSYAGLFL